MNNSTSDLPLDIGDGKEYSIAIHRDINHIKQEWDFFCSEDVYLNSVYNNVLQNSGPIDYGYYYLVISQQKAPIGVIYCQRKQLELSKDFRLHAHSDSLWEKLKVAATKFIFSFVKTNVLICGNVLLTGEYGFVFKEDGQYSTIVALALEVLADDIKNKENIRISNFILKDFHSSPQFAKHPFEQDSFYGFKVQPDMIINVDEEWTSYADYLKAVKSKYRVKFKKIKKKGSALTYRTLDAAGAKKYNSAMYNMYRATADRASFSLFLLGENYFSDLKSALGNGMRLTGVFLDEELVAFFTLIKNGDMADAHFLGYNVKLNSKHQIYFNLLLILIEQAIETRAKYLNLSRTALEIKSSVGAEPYDLTVFLKHRTPWVNKLVPRIMKRFVPVMDWVQRSPFK